MHGAVVVLGLVVAAFVIRCVLVVVFRPIAPRGAEFVDRWWIWVPWVAIIVGVAMWSLPVGALVAAVSIVIVALDPRLDLPFRNRC